MKRIAVIGSTGSIGRSTLDVVNAFPQQLSVTALAAGGNLDRLEPQIRSLRPRLVAVRDAGTADELRGRIGDLSRIVHGQEGLVEVARCEDVDLVVSALVGALGLPSTHAALEAGRDVALANKESLVAAGALMTRLASESGARILPVDSEHNALHQCLRGERPEEVRRLWLTASGGPFREHDRHALAQVTPEEALRHPTWEMGPKITIDSATLMNKGLEVIEARWLFDLTPERIRVVVHPQSVVHSMIELVDGSFKAQLGITDMRHPIQYALSWPDRWSTDLPPFDPIQVARLDFEAPDTSRFPCLALAYRALELGGAAAAALNAANEIAVEAFLGRRIEFPGIPRTIERVMERHASDPVETLEQILAADLAARESARRVIHELQLH